MKDTISTLLPGQHIPAMLPLQRYRLPQVQGSVQAALAEISKPGDIVLELGSTGPVYIRAAVQLERRMIALNVNPILLLASAIALQPIPVDEAHTALTHLGDLPKSGQPLFAHLESLYRSRCPACNRPGIAEWFAWDRDQKRPFAKQVRSARCSDPQQGPVDEQDLEAAARFPPHSGPAYHLALGRVGTPDMPQHERVAELVSLYTTRNLSALMDILHRLHQSATSPAAQRILSALLLEAMDQGNSLIAHNDARGRPRSLRPPPRFREYNIWLLLEQALNVYARDIAPIPAIGPPAPSIKALLERDAPAYLLFARPLRALARLIPEASIAAVVFQPTPPDAVFWALSALWSCWLWPEASSATLRAYLVRRRLDWDWHRHNLRRALRSLKPLLRPDPPLLFILPEANCTAVAMNLAAAAEAGLRPSHWIAPPQQGFQAILAPPSSDRQRRKHSGAARIATFLRRRGEPSDATLLQIAALVEAGAEAPALLETLPDALGAPRFTSPAAGTLWLRNPTKSKRPLADRVEEAARRLLQQAPVWTPAGIARALYQKFSGPLSPPTDLVEACIAAYTVSSDKGELALRPEDAPQARQRELRQVRALLRQLGERLDFEVGKEALWDVTWGDYGSAHYLFRCTHTAFLAPHLLATYPERQVRRCLVLPGGRAALVALKLRYDPRYQQAVTRDHWTFIKFRHLRHMAQAVQSRADIEVYLGLDPIVEQEHAQIPLPLLPGE